MLRHPFHDDDQQQLSLLSVTMSGRSTYSLKAVIMVIQWLVKILDIGIKRARMAKQRSVIASYDLIIVLIQSLWKCSTNDWHTAATMQIDYVFVFGHDPTNVGNTAHLARRQSALAKLMVTARLPFPHCTIVDFKIWTNEFSWMEDSSLLCTWLYTLGLLFFP